jgi:hypothetical protein
MGAIVGLGLCARHADAAWVRADSAVCERYSTSYSCPLLETDAMPRAAIQTLNVYVYDGHSGDEVSVQVCRKNFDSASLVCGSTDSTTNGFEGYATLQPSLEVWGESQFGTATIRVYYPETHGFMTGYLASTN